MKIEKYLGNTKILDSTLQYAYQNSIPIVATIEITQKCNFTCHHCYNFDRINLKQHPDTNNALSPMRVLKLIDELSEAGTLFLNFSGGESLISPDIFSYIEQGRKNHMEVRIKSNGALINEEMAQKLSKLELSGVDISLYGMSDDSYEKLTNKKNSLTKVLEAINFLKKYNIDTHISIILHRFNVHELDDMIGFCEKNNLLYQISTEVTARYDKTVTSRDYEITNEQFESLIKSKHASLFKNKVPKGSYQCSCARSVCGVAFNGEVYPCIGAPIPSGNIKNSPFKEIWTNSSELNKIRNLKTSDFKECVTCEVQENCNRSSGSIYINTGNYTGCEKVTLDQAKIRARNE